jgi:hypothetical protein
MHRPKNHYLAYQFHILKSKVLADSQTDILPAPAVKWRAKVNRKCSKQMPETMRSSSILGTAVVKIKNTTSAQNQREATSY